LRCTLCGVRARALVRQKMAGGDPQARSGDDAECGKVTRFHKSPECKPRANNADSAPARLVPGPHLHAEHGRNRGAATQLAGQGTAPIIAGFFCWPFLAIALPDWEEWPVSQSPSSWVASPIGLR